jgi:hypothetical protein
MPPVPASLPKQTNVQGQVMTLAVKMQVLLRFLR